MPKLTIFFAILILLKPIPAISQDISLTDQIEDFGTSRACSDDIPIVNRTQYIFWVSFVQDIMSGAIPSTVFEDCPQSGLHSHMGEIFLGTGQFAEHMTARVRLVSRIRNPVQSDDPQEMRVAQGYAASEYLIAVYLICLTDRECFDRNLMEDGYQSTICPSLEEMTLAGDTSPDPFELALFTYGGDMRYFLPYFVTNCRLSTDVEVQAAFPLFDTVSQVVNPG